MQLLIVFSFQCRRKELLLFLPIYGNWAVMHAMLALPPATVASCETHLSYAAMIGLLSIWSIALHATQEGGGWQQVRWPNRVSTRRPGSENNLSRLGAGIVPKGRSLMGTFMLWTCMILTLMVSLSLLFPFKYGSA